MTTRKKSYHEQIQDLVAEYREAGMPWPADRDQLARWMISKKKWQPRPQTLIKQLGRDIARALRDEVFKDPQGRKVRRKHAVPVQRPGPDGEFVQHLLWVDIRDAARDDIHAAFQLRRQQTAGDVKQLARDLDSYNENYNRGKEIQISFDYTLDVEEARQPTTYDDTSLGDEDLDDEDELESDDRV